HLLKHFLVIRDISKHRNRLIIFRGTTKEGGTADIDLFDGLFQGDTFLGDGCLERVKIDDEQVDRGNAICHGFASMSGIITLEEEAAMHFRMKGLHATAEEFWKPRVL